MLLVLGVLKLLQNLVKGVYFDCLLPDFILAWQIW